MGLRVGAAVSARAAWGLPTRGIRTLLVDELADRGESTAAELARRVSMSPSTVSRYLASAERAGVVVHRELDYATPLQKPLCLWQTTDLGV